MCRVNVGLSCDLLGRKHNSDELFLVCVTWVVSLPWPLEETFTNLLTREGDLSAQQPSATP